MGVEAERVTGRRIGRWIVAAVLLLPLAVGANDAHAAFPGSNGAIAFARNGHIWKIEPDGTQVKIAKGEQPSWSPDGSRIAYIRSGRRSYQIWTMAADGSDRTPILTAPSFYAAPSWSPDGLRLVFSGLGRTGPVNHDLYTIRANAPFGHPVALTQTPDADEENPEWSPNGTKIAFDQLACTTNCGYRIGVVDPDGAHYTLLTPETFDDETLPDWSPDSSTLLFTSNRADPDGLFDYDVFSMAATGGPVTRITRGAGDARTSSPAWAPDGTRFAYVHEGPLHATVTLRTAAPDGSSVVRLCRVSSFFDQPPDWQPIP
jgi:Tol biopolymer transport system component